MGTNATGASAPQARKGRKGAFTLIELLVVIAVIALLMGLLLPALGEARRTARKMLDISNLRQMGTGFLNYASEFDNRIASFSWEKHPNQSSLIRGHTNFPDLRNPTSPQMAHYFQAVDIIRRRTGMDTLPPIRTRFVHRRYSHLVMLDYLGASLPVKIAASPGDRNLLQWQRYWSDILAGDDMRSVLAAYPNPGPDAGFNRIWPLSSTYQIVPASYAPDAHGNDHWRGGNRGGRTIEQFTSDHNLFLMPGATVAADFGKRKMDEVKFPSMKVLTFAFYDFFSKDPLFYAYPQARPSVAMFDGSVMHRRTMDANPGWAPSQRRSAIPGRMTYLPMNFEPRTPSGRPSESLFVWYRWTRGGLEGIDFGGREINTGQY